MSDLKMIEEIEERLDLLDAIVNLLDERNHRWSIKDAVIRSNVLEKLKEILNDYDSTLKIVNSLHQEISSKSAAIDELIKQVSYLEERLDSK